MSDALLLGSGKKKATANYPWSRGFESSVADCISNTNTTPATTISRDTTVFVVGAAALKIVHGGTNNNHNGVHLLLPTTLDRSQTITISCWVRHAVTTANSIAIRLCNSGLAGYAVTTSGSILYGASYANRNSLDAGYKSVVVGFVINTWYRWEMIISPSGTTVKQYNASNVLQATTPFYPHTGYTSFDRIFLSNYFVDTADYFDELTLSLS